jgi:hypothetical protein
MEKIQLLVQILNIQDTGLWVLAMAGLALGCIQVQGLVLGLKVR